MEDLVKLVINTGGTLMEEIMPRSTAELALQKLAKAKATNMPQELGFNVSGPAGVLSSLLKVMTIHPHWEMEIRQK